MIKQAVIPLASLRTRLLTLINVFLIELSPVGGRRDVKCISDECIEVRIKEAIYIISIKKRFILSNLMKIKKGLI